MISIATHRSFDAEPDRTSTTRGMNATGRKKKLPRQVSAWLIAIVRLIT